MAEGAHHLLVIADPAELPPARRVWGAGGRLMPEQRAALDWLTLGRLLGWEIAVGYPGKPWPGPRTSNRRRRAPDWIVVACDPGRLDRAEVDRLRRWMESAGALVVAPAAADSDAFAALGGCTCGGGTIEGRTLTWPGMVGDAEGRLDEPVAASRLRSVDGARVWAEIDGVPAITLRGVGRGAIATLAVHPSRLRDAAPFGTAALRDLLVTGRQRPTAWLDWTGTVILRMDDPGGAHGVYRESRAYPKLGEATWREIGAVLRGHDARLGIAYIAGWVDDGDAARGTLSVDERSEFRGLQWLRGRSLAEIEVHGHTHRHPDGAERTAASDRYDATDRFREAGRDTLATRGPEHHPVTLGMAAIARHFRTTPTTLVAPGDEFTDEAVERALDLGLSAVSSDCTAIRAGDRFAWSTHLRAPALDRPEAIWFESGLPVVGRFQDRDLALHGVAWLERQLSAWRAAGAQRFIDFREFAAGLSLRVGAERRAGAVRITAQPAEPMTSPRLIPMWIWTPDDDLGAPAEEVAEGLYRLELESA